MNDNTESLLSTIEYPSDLRKLSIKQLPQVCDELRQFLINELSRNPGHFASSLGVVELTVALHYVFNTPEDRIVWDVGHQAYGHKILTGRREKFHTNRRLGGIKPFPSPQESEYDTTTCGHASVSISAALGMAVAANRQKTNRHVVAVIGDGAMSGGLAFEGLNNAGCTPNNMLIILNDNNMSIDHAVGGMKDYLHQLHTSSTYNRLRNKVAQKLTSWGWLSDKGKRRIMRLNNSIKSFIHNQQNVFEGMDIRYFGPHDGHDVISLVYTLQSIKEMTGPRLLHIHTQKGHGYQPAEDNPTVFHAPGKFDPETGERIKSNAANMPPRYQDVFGETLLDLARCDERIVGITPAMPSGCSMNIMMREMPERCFDVGIAEGHAVTFSAGLAAAGSRPFCNIYSSFMQRAYDNVIHDVALQNLPVVLCLDRAGLVGEDGATHHGAFDLVYFSCVPNMTIAAPRNEWQLRQMMYAASKMESPMVIRYPRGLGEGVEWRNTEFVDTDMRAEELKAGSDVAIIAVGTMANVALRAAQRSTRSVAVYDLRYVKPLDTELLNSIGSRFSKVITIEDGAVRGGVGETIAAYFAREGYTPRVKNLGIGDCFVQHGKPTELYADCAYDEAALLTAIENI